MPFRFSDETLASGEPYLRIEDSSVQVFRSLDEALAWLEAQPSAK